MNTLDEIKAELLAYETARPRSLQVETGASGMFGCRAQTLLRLSGVPQSDPRLGWQALVGTAIHAVAEKAAALSTDVLTESRFQYRGVWCTIDRFDIAGHKITDLKTKDDDVAIAKVQKYGPTKSQIAQVQIGAAALIAAGYEVDTVELLFVPRAGDLESAYLWSAPFDQALADEAADWSAAQDARAADVDARGLDVTGALDGLRDEPERFCRDYCEWVTLCRGPERVMPSVDDPFVIAAAADVVQGKAMVAEGEALVKSARPILAGISGMAGDNKIGWSGGNENTTEVVDLDAVLAGYREWIGDPPTKTVVTVSNVSLRVTPVKPKESIS